MIFWKLMKKCLKSVYSFYANKCNLRTISDQTNYLKSLLSRSLAMNCDALIYFPSRDQCDTWFHVQLAQKILNGIYLYIYETNRRKKILPVVKERCFKAPSLSMEIFLQSFFSMSLSWVTNWKQWEKNRQITLISSVTELKQCK